MKKKYVKIVLVFLLILFLLGVVALFTFLGIQRKKHIAELEQVELPEIVFVRSVNKTDNTFATRIINKDGEVYYFEGNRTMEELIQLYREKRMKEELDFVREIGINDVKEKYNIFLELASEGQYEVRQPGGLPDVIDSRYTWYGFFYDSNMELQSMLIYVNYIQDYEVTDVRGKELADWITDTVLD